MGTYKVVLKEPCIVRKRNASQRLNQAPKVLIHCVLFRGVLQSNVALTSPKFDSESFKWAQSILRLYRKHTATHFIIVLFTMHFLHIKKNQLTKARYVGQFYLQHSYEEITTNENKELKALEFHPNIEDHLKYYLYTILMITCIM